LRVELLAAAGIAAACWWMAVARKGLPRMFDLFTPMRPPNWDGRSQSGDLTVLESLLISPLAGL
jgi:hypothetical protein